MLRTYWALVAITFMASAAPVNAAIIYSVDDGSAESSLASTGNANTNLWLNVFTVVAGGEQINSIDIAFGAATNMDPPANGTPATVYLWTSASNNPNPTVDASVVSSVAGTVQSIHTNTFITFALPVPVLLNVGDVFFVGFQSTDFAVGADTNSPAGQSWIFTNFDNNPIDPNNLAGTVVGGEFGAVGFPGNALIRANGSSISTVPEPGTFTLAGLAAFGLIGRVIRRRRAAK